MVLDTAISALSANPFVLIKYGIYKIRGIMKIILFGLALILFSIYSLLAAVFCGWPLFDAISAGIAILGLAVVVFGQFEDK